MAEETKIIRIIVDSSRAVGGAADATRALEKLERGTASMDGALSRMEKGLASVGGMVKAQLSLMVAELGARFLQMAKDSLSAAAGLDELAEQLGITTVGLQALQFSAVQNGVKLEQLETGISKFSQKMGEAAGGSKEMVEALTALGVKNLDVQGKLRPTEALLSEVAAAITKIEDPAKRSAAAVDFFGKAGSRMLPMLKDIAGGFDDMAEKARRSGAMISKEAIEKLDKLGDSAEIAGLRVRALFAENAAGPLTDILDFIARKMENVGKILSAAKGDWLAILALLAGGVPGLVGRAMAPTEKERVTSELADQRRRSTEAWTDLGDPKLSSRERPSAMSAYAAAQARIPQLEAQLNVLEVGGRAEYRPSDPDGIGINMPRVSKGASTSAIKGAGQGEGDKYAKLVAQLTLAADAQDKMTAAARSGDVAFQDQEIKLKAAEKALGIYGQALDATDPRLQKIEELISRDTMGKAAQSYVTATTEIEKQNEVLEAEIRLINATIPARAAEIALIKAKQDADKSGQALTPQDKEGRRVAIEQNERLKAQGDEIRKANELWTAPLKTALSSIQTTAADAFEGMLNSGKINFQSLGDVFKKTVTRMIAEFMALQFVRPVMSVVVSALGGAGIVSPATASSLGFGGGPGGSISGGGMSMPSMPSMGGGMFGSASDWTSSAGSGFSMPEFMGGSGSGSIAGFFGQNLYGGSAIAGPLQPGAASLGMSGGVSLGGALSGAMGIGMGAYSLFNAKNTAQTLGGIGQMIGGGMMLIPGMQIPGMIVSVLSSVLPSLLGGDEYKWAPLSGASTRFDPSAGGYTQSSTEQLGGKSIGGQFSSVKTAIDAIFKQTGGTLDLSKAFGGAVWNNQREGTTSTYIISPVVGSAQLSEAGGDPTKAVEAMIAKIFYNTATTEGALTGVSPTLTKALAGHEPTTLKEVDAVLSLVAAYDKLGETVSPMKKVMDDVTESFRELTEGAEKYGLSLEPIKEQERKAKRAVYDQFVKGEETDPIKAATKTYNDAFKAIGETLKVFVDEAEALGLSADQIRADTLEVYHRVGDAYKKQVDEIEYSKAIASSNFTFGHANARMALSDPTRASIDASRRQMGFDYKAAIDMGGTPLEQMARGAEVMRTYQAQMQKMTDDFVNSMKRGYETLLDPALAAAADAWEARKADLQKAMAIDGSFFDGLLRVGPVVEAASKFWNEKIFKAARDIQYGTEQALLAFTNPLQASLNALHKERDEAIKTAVAANTNVSKVLAEQYARAQALDEIRFNDQWAIKEITKEAAKASRDLTEAEQKRIEGYQAEIALADAAGAAMNRTFATQNAQYVELANITELFLKKEAALREQYYAQSLSSLEALIKRLTFGDLSGASPTSMLAGTRGDYRATLSAAQSGDIKGLENLSGAADTYVQSARSYFASSPEYYAIVKEVKDAITAIDVNIRAGNITPGGATGGNAIDAGAWAGIVTSLQEMVSTQNQQIAVLREELGTTNALLRRQLLNA